MGYIDFCKKHGYFTCGNAEQYDFCIATYNAITQRAVVSWNAFERLAAMTYICSDIDKFDFWAVRNEVMCLLEENGVRIE